jgi:hypothetical protein
VLGLASGMAQLTCRAEVPDNAPYGSGFSRQMSKKEKEHTTVMSLFIYPRAPVELSVSREMRMQHISLACRATALPLAPHERENKVFRARRHPNASPEQKRNSQHMLNYYESGPVHLRLTYSRCRSPQAPQKRTQTHLIPIIPPSTLRSVRSFLQCPCAPYVPQA